MPTVLADLNLTVRTLPDDELHRIAEAGGPMAGHPQAHSLADKVKIPVLERDGQILGYWVLSDLTHMEPLWLAPEIRHQPKAAMALLAQVYTELQAAGVRFAFAVIDEADEAVIGSMAAHLGLKPLPGKLYGGFIPPKE